VEFQIRSANADDFTTINEVLIESFGKGMFNGCAYERFRAWAYLENPDRYPELTTEWIVESDGAVVAVRGVMPAQVVMNGTMHRSGWLQNIAVRPQARRQGLSRKVLRHVIDHNGGMTMCLGMVPASRALARSENARFINADEVVVLPLVDKRTYKRGVRTLLKGHIAEALTMLLSPLRKAKAFKMPSRSGSVVIESVTQFDSSFARPLGDMTSGIRVMLSRSVEKLNWFMACPMIETSAYIATKNGVATGYLIYREDGAVLDLLTAPDDIETFDALLQHGVRRARDQGHSQLLACLPGIPTFIERYHRLGFLSLLRDFGFFYTHADPQKSSIEMDEPSNWYLSLADSDLCTFKQEW